ncbi:hypothetical protein [Niastella sp. OAS944]|uniref:hypothetical protein n=1 Tax=Niastella sp. OAS944 TaxID=2664089 RepID=UPI00348F2A40|nr:hypothetical protein [Chitinophagaceae bacterium OAS944]
MKRLLSSLIVILLVIVSCKKEKNDEEAVPEGEDYGCIERSFYKPNDHTISSNEVAIANMLFSTAKIDFSQFRYYQYKHDTGQYFRAPYTMRDKKFVWVERGDRGLRVFKGERLYLFWDDTLVEPSPTDIDVSHMVSGMDTTSNLSLARVRRLFRHDMEMKFPTDNNSQRIDYTDTCFVAEFGFYVQTVDRQNHRKCIKAWRVAKKNSANDVPAGYYDDESGKLLTFIIHN